MPEAYIIPSWTIFVYLGLLFFTAVGCYLAGKFGD